MVASSSPPNNIVTGPYHDDIGVDQNRTLCLRPDASRQNVSPRFQVRQQGRASSRASSRGPPTLSREAQNLHEVDGKSAAEATRPSGTGLPPSGTPQVSWCCRSGLRVRTCLLCGEVPELVGKALLTKERSSHSTDRTASHLPGAYKLATPLVHNVPRTVLVRQPSRNNDDPQRRDPRSHKLHTYTRPQNALSFG
ncbi:hypothetical protein PCL_10386 [Purpureocillium lilacinum]|uniref:Uncharacterized protein n=1 Tax=Purpureocillium lilacinum TaxID=33203 RepID=A0A2U3EFT4_PURLI|nr:hypothetical protein PCL_10386 [Purpureocillium lilacinum]